MKERFDTSSYKISKLVTNHYSTSFSLGIMLLGPSIKPAIYSIYGFVRYADEIVDSFNNYNQEELFNEFIDDYQKALNRKISVNPILNSFQSVVHQYDIFELVQCFLESMRMDLDDIQYSDREQYEKYIHGSADVVGLMCLKVFLNGNQENYIALKPFAKKLGSAFQKVNFLRDFAADVNGLGRSYFPNVNLNEMDESTKNKIILDIEKDFSDAMIGIRRLPKNCKFGVYVAYKYYKALLRKLSNKSSEDIMSNRIRIANHIKMVLLIKSYFRYKINIL